MDVETFDSLDGWRQKIKMTLMTFQEHGWHPKLTKNSVKEQERRYETENNRKPISQV